MTETAPPSNPAVGAYTGEVDLSTGIIHGEGQGRVASVSPQGGSLLSPLSLLTTIPLALAPVVAGYGKMTYANNSYYEGTFVKGR